MKDKYNGLSHQQAKQKLQQFGPNEIKDIGAVSPWLILFRQIRKNFMIYLLAAAAIISFSVGKSITGYVILIVIVTVAMAGFIQEFKAEKSIQALKKMIMPVSIVRRAGKEHEIPSAELVPEDIVVLRTGEKIPADCLILEANELKVNESILTGESAEVNKQAASDPNDLKDQNYLYMGTYILGGRAIAQISHTGMNTKFGKIAGMISTAEKVLPLQNKINHISKYMVVIALSGSVLIGLIMLSRMASLTSDGLVNILILIIALSVAAFPEGLPVVLITTLAVGANRMAKKNAIVNRMSIIETLGETTVICSDKTGTITRGEMTVNQIYTDGKLYEISGIGYQGNGNYSYKGRKINPQENQSLLLSIKTASLCNESVIERTGNDMEYQVNGSATEGALLIMAAKAGIHKEDFKYEQLKEIPFSSERKMMSSVGKENGQLFVFSKGALEVLIEQCDKFQKKDKIIEMTKKEKKEILNLNNQMTSKALRTLALAYRKIGPKETNYEQNFIFLGLVGMEDPPREKVDEAISTCFKAGIKVKMITGDNQETAVAIGKQIGLAGKTLTGDKLDKLSDDELKKIVAEISIFARVRPEHKLRIVKALKDNKEIVTMTGDGVNDAPALKEAHIGVAMGKNGTDVSRSAADITLKDDNFSTIVAAIKEGRGIFNNIRKFVTYQLSCNFAELSILFIGVLLAPVLGWQTPLLLALHILFMNLVTSDLPALTLAFTPVSHDIMNDKPRKKSQILTTEFIGVVLFNGIMMAAATLLTYYIMFNMFNYSLEVSRTAALVVLIITEITTAYSFRSFRYGVINRGIFVNKYLVHASFASLFLTLLIVYTPLSLIFETAPLNYKAWIIGLLMSLIILCITDLLKGINNVNQKLLPYKNL